MVATVQGPQGPSVLPSDRLSPSITPRLIGCPSRGDARYFDSDTGAIWSPSCGVNTCAYCIRTNAWRFTRALGVVKPSRYAVFTLLSGDWQTDRASINALFRALDRKGYRLRAAYTIEENPKKTGFHLNVWWWGPDVPQQLLSDVAQSVGWGEVVYVERWRSGRRDGYGLKDALGYGMKDAVGSSVASPTLTENQETYLRINGGRLLHARRGFWRNGVGGEDLRTAKAAFRASFGERPERKSSWVMYSGSQVLAHSPVTATPSVEDTPSETAPRPTPGSSSDGAPLVVADPLPLSWPAPAKLTSSGSSTSWESSAPRTPGLPRSHTRRLSSSDPPRTPPRSCS